MSTFSGLNTAASGLAAARRGMDVVGQNIANQKTEGYTRQRVTTSAVAAIAQTGRFSVGALPGHGVSIDGVARLGDALLDARVRDALGASGYWSTRAVAATTVEASLAEPTANGLAARLSKFWSGWQDLANTPDSGQRPRASWNRRRSSPRTSPAGTGTSPPSGAMRATPPTARSPR